MKTTEQIQQTEETQTDELGNIPSEVGRAVLGNGNSLSDGLTLAEWDEQKVDEADTIHKLLNIPRIVIDQSFGNPPNDDDGQRPVAAKKLREFNMGMVRDITGKTEQEAAESLTNLSSLVSTIVNGIAKSDRFKDHIVSHRRNAYEDLPSDAPRSFAATLEDISHSPDAVVNVGHSVLTDSSEGPSVEMIHAEFRHPIVDAETCVVLDMKAGEAPTVLQKKYHLYGSELAPLEDPDTEESEALALVAGLAMAYAKYSENDIGTERLAAELEVAERGTLVI